MAMLAAWLFNIMLICEIDWEYVGLYSALIARGGVARAPSDSVFWWHEEAGSRRPVLFYCERPTILLCDGIRQLKDAIEAVILVQKLAPRTSIELQKVVIALRSEPISSQECL